MSEEGEKKGFAGLTSLASQIDPEKLSKKSSTSSSANPSETPRGTKPSNPTGEATSKAPPTKQSATPLPPPSPAKKSFGMKWFLGIAAVIGVTVAYNNATQNVKKSPPPKSNYTPSVKTQSSPSPRVKTAINFQKPPIGRDNVLLVAQIRWCLRENILMDTKRPLISTNRDVNRFNQTVVDYNRRCGSYKHRRGSLERAKREVEAMRSQIVASALGGPSGNWSTTASTGNKNSNFQAVFEAQTLLARMGYNPGKPDGIFGKKTKAAIEAFERRIGKTPTGHMTDEILRMMRERID